MQPTNNLYKENAGLIKSRAKYYSQKYHVPFEDVESEANEVFCHACLSYSSCHGTRFSTHLYSRLGKLNYYCKTLYREWEHIEDIENMYLPTKMPDKIEFEESIKALTPPVQGLIHELIATGQNLTITYIKQFLKVGYEKAVSILHEIKDWWGNLDEDLVYI
ncbi:hypothetical protein KAR91_77090 [Candidatus Pacearchaeota archaeon]|nr:hypothetical protein [Candidatus Pacearchaeota archaeon]